MFDVDGGQGLRQFTELALALLLSSLIGLERQARQQSAGLRTHTLVGVRRRISYLSRHGVLGRLLETCTGSGFRVTNVQVTAGTDADGAPAEVALRLEGPSSPYLLVEKVSELTGVQGVALGRQGDSPE